MQFVALHVASLVLVAACNCTPHVVVVAEVAFDSTSGLHTVRSLHEVCMFKSWYSVMGHGVHDADADGTVLLAKEPA